MSFVRLLLNAVPLAFGYCCLATVLVQAAGVTVLWSTGKLTKAKTIRYAAIAYGRDVTDLPAEHTPEITSETSEKDLTHEQLLDKRVNANESLVDRIAAMTQQANTIRSLEKELKSERDRRATVRKNFRSYLDDLEKEVVIASLGDVQHTLENLSPRQAKDIILRTLDDEGLDEGDDVVEDIVTIVKAMPESKLKKILGEFKTAEEQEKLHRIVMEIGDLNDEGRP